MGSTYNWCVRLPEEQEDGVRFLGSPPTHWGSSPSPGTMHKYGMRFYEFYESAYANLYHVTRISDLNQIFDLGYIKPNQGDENNEISISLTRDKRYGFEIYGNVQLTIDQSRLRQTHKVKPIDYDRTINQLYGDHDDKGRESEERVYKSIPLSYVLKIEIFNETPSKLIVQKAEKRNLPLFVNGKRISTTQFDTKEFVVTDPKLTPLMQGQELSAEELRQAQKEYGDFKFTKNIN